MFRFLSRCLHGRLLARAGQNDPVEAIHIGIGVFVFITFQKGKEKKTKQKTTQSGREERKSIRWWEYLPKLCCCCTVVVGGVDGNGAVEPIGLGADLGRPVKGENLISFIFFFSPRKANEKGLSVLLWKVIGGCGAYNYTFRNNLKVNAFTSFFVLVSRDLGSRPSS